MNIAIETTIYARAPRLFAQAAAQHGLTFHQFEPLDTARALALHDDWARVFIIGTKRYPDAFYGNLRSGTLVQRFGVGADSVPISLCRDRGVYVGYTPGVLEPAVAEHTMALILALARRVCTLDREMRAGEWRKIEAVELRGKTLALIGFGRIAREVARMAKYGFGMRVTACGRRAAPEPAHRDLVDHYGTDLAAALRDADIISIHLPQAADTVRMIDAAALSLLRPTALLVNTARGSVIDEPALYAALASKRIAGAALDVFTVEPYVPTADAPTQADFRTLDNCILTPHCGSNTGEANERMAEICIAQCVALAGGKTTDLIQVS